MAKKSNGRNSDITSINTNILPSFQQMVDNAFEGVWVMDADFHTIYVNSRLCEMLGYSRNELLQIDPTKLFLPEDLSDHSKRMKNRASNKAEQYELRFRCKDGSSIWMTVSANPLLDQDGHFAGSFATYTDISERKERERIGKILSFTQEKLARLEDIDQVYQLIGEKIREIIGSGIVGTTTVDEKAMTISISHLFGIDSSFYNLVKKFNIDPTEIKYPMKDAPIYALKMFQNGRLLEFEGGLYSLLMKKIPKFVCKIAEKQLEIDHILMMGLVSEGAHFGGVVIMVKDDISFLTDTIEAIVYQATEVIKRLRSENVMRISNDRLYLTFDAINDGYWDWDIPSGEIITNDKWFTMLGYARNEFLPIYGNFIKLIHPSDLSETQTNINHSIEISGDFAIEFRLRMKNGDYKWIHSRGKVISKDANGQALRMVGTHTDITERKNHEMDTLLFYETQRKLLQVTNFNDLYQLIGDGLTTLLGNGYAVFTRKDQFSNVIKVVGLYGFGKNAEDLFKTFRITERNLDVRLEDIDEDNLKLWNSNSLVQYNDGLYGILTKKLPKKICQAIEKRFSINKIYVMGCKWNEQNFGGFVLLTKNGLGQNKELIETLINDTSIAIQRIITEEEIRIAQRRYQDIFEESPIGIVTVGLNFKFLSVNREFCNICGYSEEELMDMTFKDITHPDHIKNDVEQIGKLIAGEIGIYSTEKKYIKKGGEIVWGKLLVNKVCDPQGKFLYLLAMVMDVSKETIAEEKIRENRRFLETVLDTIPNMVFVRDSEGRYQLANRPFAEAMGSTTEDIIGKTNVDLGDSIELAKLVQQGDSDILASGKSWINPDMKLFFPAYGKKSVQLVKKALPDAHGKISAVLGVITDISDQKKAEDALQKSEQKHRRLIENSRDIIYTLSKTGEFTFVSNAWVNLLGFRSEKVIGTHFSKYLHPDDINKCADALQKLVETGEEQTGIEYRIKHVDRSWRWHTTSAVPIYDENDNCIGIEGTALDITERKLAEEALHESEERYRLLVEQSPVGIMLVKKGKFIYANKTGLQLMGFDNGKDIVGQPVIKFIHPDSQKALMKRVLDLEKTADNPLMEIKIVRKNGDIVETESTSSQIRLGGEEVTLIFGQDISERKKAEIQIMKNTDDLTLLKTLNDSVNRGDPLQKSLANLIDSTKRIFSSNGAAVYLLSPDDEYMELQSLQIPEEIVNWIENRIHVKIPKTRIKLNSESLYRQILAEKKFRLLEGRENVIRLMMEFTDNPVYKKLIPLIYKRLGIHSVIAIPIISHGVSVGLLELSSKTSFETKDLERLEFISSELGSIIRRKQAEEGLQESEEKFRQIVERSNDVFFRQSYSSMLFEYISPKIYDMLGYTQAEILHFDQKQIDAVIHPEDIHIFKKFRPNLLENARIGKSSFEREFRILNKKGEYIWCHGNYTLINDAKGDPQLIVCTLSDINDRKTNESIINGRVKLMQIASKSSLNELLTASLDEMESLTTSKFGFFYILDEDQAGRVTQAWSTKTLDLFKADKSEVSFSLNEAGIWRDLIKKHEPVIQNDFPALQKSKGFPYDHITVNREMVVPIFRNEKIVAVIGLGNKPIDYSQTDLELIMQFTDMAWDIVENKHIDEALKESETIFSAFMENSPIYVFFKDKEIRSKNLSRNYEQMLGKPLDELLHKNMFELFPSEIAKQMVADDKKILNEGKAFTIDEELDGRFYTTIKFPILRDGKPEFLAGFTIDITDRVLSEKKLAESEEMYRLISSVVSDYLFSTKINEDNVLALNWVAGAFETITGYTLAEYVQAGGWRARLYPDDLEVDDRDLQKLRENQKVITEIRTIKKDGSVIWVQTYSLPIWDEEKNQLIGINGAVQDITERKKAEETIKKTAREFEALYDTAKDYSMHRDPYVILRTIADRACQLFGVSNAFVYIYDPEIKDLELKFTKLESQPLGMRIKLGEGISGQVAETLKPIFINDYASWDKRLPYYTESSIAAILCVPLLYGGQLIGVLGIHENHPSDLSFSEDDAHFLSLFASQAAGAVYSADLFEKLRINATELEKRVNERTKELQNKNKELETFTYTVSHDLKAPLRGISGYSTLLLEDHADELNEEGKRYLQNLVDSTERMNRLIEDLLTYSRVERREIKRTNVNLNDLLDKIILEYQSEVVSKNLCFKKELEYDTLFTDIDGISQALRNIIDNAVKFTKGCKDPQIIIHCSKMEDHYLISIEDNGIGFDMKYHGKIFEIFQRLHLSEEYPGTGVGLAVVRKAVERLNGKIWAVSEPGIGSTFYMELPL